MRGNSSTNLVNKEVSVQAVLKIYLSKLRHYIFSEKVESPYFTNLEKGGQKGGQGKANFSLKFQLEIDFFSFLLYNFKLKLAFPWPPFGHPFPNS